MSPRARLAIALASTLLVGYVALGSLLGRVLGDTTTLLDPNIVAEIREKYAHTES